ncbi:MAG: saccharopine dehydrogenase C-terminal domain-containing protein [Candidatus Zixiibacteriota bacterium]
MKILILGAGLMARGAAFDYLQNQSVESVTVADSSHDALASFRARFPDSRVQMAQFHAHDKNRVLELMRGADGVFCAVHYGFNLSFTEAAIATRTHMVDLGGNNDVVAAQRALNDEASRAGVSIIPDCGLAPGMVSILVAWGLKRFDWADTVRIRVGGLPLNPKEPFEYERLFSVEGLINEYVEPPVALSDGRIVIGEPLGELETVEFDQPVGTLEAFNTSGGTSTLPETFGKRVRNLNYKTLRYPGHTRAMRWLNSLGLFSSEPIDVDGVRVIPRRLTAQRIAAAVPLCERDRTVVRVEFAGAGKMHRLEIIDEYDAPSDLTSMMRMTAFPAAIISQMQCDGRIAKKGVVPQEVAVDSETFIREFQARGVKIKGV